MSPISIERFWNAGGQSRAGEVRMARDGDDQLVNKGTLGHRMASAIQNFARSIGLIRPDPTRAQRQQQALESFTASLRHRYGRDNANIAIQQAGLDQEGARLTGHAIRNTIVAAAAQRQSTRLDNQNAMQALLPPSTGNTSSNAFRTLVAQLDPELDADHLDPQVARVYTQRLNEAVRDVSRQGRQSLSHQDLGELAKSTLKSVLKLHQTGQLEASIQARADYRDALGQLVRDMACGCDAGRVMDRMSAALKAFDKLLAAEKMEEAGGAEFHAFTQTALTSFMESLGDPGRASHHALAKALSNGGALRHVMLALNHLTDNPNMPLEQQRQAESLKSLATNLVQTLGTRGSHTGSFHGDMDLLQTSPREDGRPPTQALQQVHARLSSTPTGAQAMINEILRVHGHVAPNDGIPDWHSEKTLEHLDTLLHGTHRTLGQSIPALINEFRTALEGRSDVPPGLRDKLHAGLDVLESRHALSATLKDTASFPSLPEDRLWQLFSSAEQHDKPDFSGWNLEHCNQGSVGGMQRAFTRMLEDQKSGAPLDADWLEQIHVEATRNNFRTEALALTYKESVQSDPETMREMLQMARLSPGYRTAETNLTLKLDTSTTQAGRAELLALSQSDSWFGDMRMVDADNAFEIQLRSPPSPEAAKERATAILAEFHSEIGQATNDDEKLLAIARATQNLYRSHLFEDGNTRSVVFVAMNRMLLDAGLPPAVLADPKAAAGFSLEEFVQHIRDGQERLAHLD